MADNVAITAGTGTTVAADELTDGTLGSVKVQYVKLMDGTLDSSNKAIIDSSGRLSVLADTELPAASALADAMANPTTPLIGACLMVRNPNDSNFYRVACLDGNTDGLGPFSQNQITDAFGFVFNGTGWDRARGDTTAGMWVQTKGQASYAASTNGTVAIPTTLSTTTSLAYLWHPSSVTGKRYEIYQVEIDVEGPTTASAAGQVTTLRLAKITAENGTPGGTSQTINPVDPADAASGGTFRTAAAAPTRTSGDLASWQIQTVATNQHQVFQWNADQQGGGKPLISRVSTAEGWEIRAVTNGTAIGAAVNAAITFWWREV